MDTNKFEEIKQLHIRIREDAMKASKHQLKFKSPRGWEWTMPHRSMLLLWGFVRGVKYRRIERTTREGNTPNLHLDIWQMYVPEITAEQVQAWLEDPTGAIPAPPPRPKKPYVAAAE
jgi:hypothetical protein